MKMFLKEIRFNCSAFVEFNLKKKTQGWEFNGWRLVYDDLKDKSTHDVVKMKDRLSSVRAARMEYHNYLDEQKKKMVAEQRNSKRKLYWIIIKCIKNKRMKIEKAMNIMLNKADEISIKAEKQCNFSLLTKLNA